MANRGEHGVREVEAELLAKWSGRRRAVVAGRANSAEARRERWRRRARACSVAMLWLAEWRGKWGARRGRAGEGERVEWRGPPGCHPYAVAGVRRPRGGRGLTLVGHGARAGGRASAEAGWAVFGRGPRSEGAAH